MKYILIFFILFISITFIGDVEVNNSNFYVETTNGNISFNCQQNLDALETNTNTIILSENSLISEIQTSENVSICISNSNDSSTININSSSPSDVKYKIYGVKSDTQYQYAVNGVPIGLVFSDSSGIIESSFRSSGNSTYLFSINVITSFQETCSEISPLVNSAFIIFSVGFMIIGFVMILIQLRSPNPVIILNSIFMIIIGFTLLLFGQNLVYEIISTIGC